MRILERVKEPLSLQKGRLLMGRSPVFNGSQAVTTVKLSTQHNGTGIERYAGKFGLFLSGWDNVADRGVKAFLGPFTAQEMPNDRFEAVLAGE